MGRGVSRGQKWRSCLSAVIAGIIGSRDQTGSSVCVGTGFPTAAPCGSGGQNCYPRSSWSEAATLIIHRHIRSRYSCGFHHSGSMYLPKSLAIGVVLLAAAFASVLLIDQSSPKQDVQRALDVSDGAGASDAAAHQDIDRQISEAFMGGPRWNSNPLDVATEPDNRLPAAAAKLSLVQSRPSRRAIATSVATGSVDARIHPHQCDTFANGPLPSPQISASVTQRSGGSSDRMSANLAITSCSPR